MYVGIIKLNNLKKEAKINHREQRNIYSFRVGESLKAMLVQ